MIDIENLIEELLTEGDPNRKVYLRKTVQAFAGLGALVLAMRPAELTELIAEYGRAIRDGIDPSATVEKIIVLFDEGQRAKKQLTDHREKLERLAAEL